ncbi:MAG: hypothetical protein AAF542_16400 [Pseudomonadota bacterium]
MRTSILFTRGKQTGGALVEFVLVASVLAPLLILMPTLAKNADVSMATSQAARYGAWEQTVIVKGGDELATEINNRFYAKANVGINSAPGALSGDSVQRQFWGGAGMSDRLFSAGEEGIGVQVSESSLGGKAGQVESAIHKFGNAIGSIVPDSEWDLGGGKLYTVDVGLEIKDDIFVNEESSGQGCDGEQAQAKACVTQRSAILTDTWGARGPGQVQQRVRSLVPGGALEPFGEVVASAGEVLPLFQELKDLDGAFGLVMPDVLPEDRYGTEEK